MTPDLTCKEVARLISDGLDGELPPQERARMRLHFVLCEACRNVNEQFAFLRKATQGLGQQKRPD
jgi:predicted anti-sigma-YlaC factor YlaD